MKTNFRLLAWCMVAALVAAREGDSPVFADTKTGTVPAEPSAPKASAWQAPRPDAVKTQALAWLEQTKADVDARAKAAALWNDLGEKPAELEVLARLAGTFAAGDENAAALLRLCAKPKDQFVLPPQAWLTDSKTPPLMANNLRLLYGRWLVHAELYDEALEQLSGLNAGDVVAPATLLFYQGVAYHTLLDKTAGLKAIAKLLEGADDSPRRYVAVARLMQEDLKALKDDSLDHVARRMNDVRRRLDLGRGGKKVRGVEDGIIESLDKIIKKLEDQQAAAAAAAGMQDTIRSSKPAPDSVPMGGKGPGEITKKNFGKEFDWGHLPPKEREEALQRISREFPPHYRELIEQYYREMAREGSEEPDK
jgi:hypothetical protein